jgi:hypothetical protein
MELVTAFPFHKLKDDKYLMLNVLMHLKYDEALKYMFALNKEARSFIDRYFITLNNGFTNDGLIEFVIEKFTQYNEFKMYAKL